jgi:hypothetical protein
MRVQSGALPTQREREYRAELTDGISWSMFIALKRIHGRRFPALGWPTATSKAEAAE